MGTISTKTTRHVSVEDVAQPAFVMELPATALELDGATLTVIEFRSSDGVAIGSLSMVVSAP